MSLKIVMGTKSGKTFQKELSSQEAEALYGRVLGDELNGELFGYSGVKLQITGGSDSSGFPMRKDLPGTKRKRLLLGKSTGFSGKHRGGKSFGGLRVKKSIAGNTVFEKTHQLNLKVIKGDEILEKAFAPKSEEKKSDENIKKEE